MTIDVPAPTIGPDGERQKPHNAQACVARASEEHRWCYVSEQEPEEVLVVGLWDSDRQRGHLSTTGTMHSSVDVEGREGEEPRMSLELRCLALW